MGDKRDERFDQTAPVPNDNVCIQDLVMEDMARRKQMGLTKYGTVLQPDNGRSFLLDLYYELLDACNYVRGELYEKGIEVK